MHATDTSFATLVGGGPCDITDINLSLTFAPYLVGVDSGADRILAAGMMPRRVYGDMDSLSQQGREILHDRITCINEQVTTDFDKALRSTAARIAIAVGFSGGRLDHELAVLNALVCNAAHACIVMGEESLTFLCPPSLYLNLPAGTQLSLFPMAPVRLASQGLLWPTNGIAFAPNGRIGTSNAVADRVELIPSNAAMLVIVPRVHLGAVVAALDTAAGWSDISSSEH